MLRVHAVLRGQVDDARVAHVLEQGRVAAEMVLEEHALAQAGLGDLDPLEAADLHDRLHDDRAAEDDVAARGLDAGELGALGRRARGQLVDEAIELVARDDVALDAGLGHLEVALRRGGEVADGPADANQAGAATTQPRGALELGRDVADELADLLRLGRAVAGKEALAHAHGAQAPGVELARVAADDVHELHRAAADVEHDAVGERG